MITAIVIKYKVTDTNLVLKTMFRNITPQHGIPYESHRKRFIFELVIVLFYTYTYL